MITLLFVNPPFLGGQTTFTVHLARGIRACGIPTQIVRIGTRTERSMRNFGYGEYYRIMSLYDAAAIKTPKLITATSPKLVDECNHLIKAGARVVIHDPTHFGQGWDWKAAKRPIAIRASMKEHIPSCAVLKHPYDPVFTNYQPPTGKWGGVSICRITSNKHIEMLLDANRLMKGKDHIHIRGAQHGPYINFWLSPRYPEWDVKSKTDYPKSFGYAVNELCHEADFTCDMSVLKGDGGGTQYAFLEAVDAGSCLIVNRDWLLPSGVMVDRQNCLAASNGKEIAHIISSYRSGNRAMQKMVESVRHNARQLIHDYNARVVAQTWIDELKTKK